MSLFLVEVVSLFLLPLVSFYSFFPQLLVQKRRSPSATPFAKRKPRSRSVVGAERCSRSSIGLQPFNSAPFAGPAGHRCGRRCGDRDGAVPRFPRSPARLRPAPASELSSRRANAALVSGGCVSETLPLPGKRLYVRSRVAAWPVWNSFVHGSASSLAPLVVTLPPTADAKLTGTQAPGGTAAGGVVLRLSGLGAAR